ncbi:hypothetical protein BJY16_006353 [Actinoplanes octamycinicus]|uniref:Uncharacterized protein n=1 Tax=Actinoplanes octamycinicus TaxID=135948 RepID=A0A7W7MAC4_9ACTN|nr:hypothetical protein [Actinoplanes octamycinicus]MBB4742894.1 hypothetical protein [Actinoplanes octamycinicus]GIE58254.1 hypothetical protein Aoc01nite_36560 [Actinoplanes octamycinicus]
MTTIDRGKLGSYERQCVGEELSRLSWLLDTVITPYAQQHPDDEWAHLVLGQLTGARTALQLLARGE